MIATVAVRQSPQDVALTKALTKRCVVRTEDEDDQTRAYFMATERRWNPQSQEVRFILEPIAA